MKPLIALLVRHFLTAVGGSLVTKGIIAASMVEPLTGAVLLIGGVVASYAQKKRTGVL